jgi:hypothetical protein
MPVDPFPAGRDASEDFGHAQIPPMFVWAEFEDDDCSFDEGQKGETAHDAAV